MNLSQSVIWPLWLHPASKSYTKHTSTWQLSVDMALYWRTKPSIQNLHTKISQINFFLVESGILYVYFVSVAPPMCLFYVSCSPGGRKASRSVLEDSSVGIHGSGPSVCLHFLGSLSWAPGVLEASVPPPPSPPLPPPPPPPPPDGRSSPAVAYWTSNNWVAGSNPLRGNILFHH